MNTNTTIDYLASPDFSSLSVWLFIIGILVVTIWLQSKIRHQWLYWLIMVAAIVTSSLIAYCSFQSFPLLFLGLALSIMGSCVGQWWLELTT